MVCRAKSALTGEWGGRKKKELIMTGKGGKQRRLAVSVNLTPSEMSALENIISVSGFEVAAFVRWLLLALINGKVRLQELLQKYREKINEPKGSGRNREHKTSELKIHRVCVRLTQREKHELNVLAQENFYRPAELIRIILILFVMGVVKPSDIME